MWEEKCALQESAHWIEFCRNNLRWVALVELLKQTSETDGNSVPDPGHSRGNTVSYSDRELSAFEALLCSVCRGPSSCARDTNPAARVPDFFKVAFCPCPTFTEELCAHNGEDPLQKKQGRKGG